MTLYYHKDSYELKNIEDAIYNEWIESNNPKASIYLLAPNKPAENAVWANGSWTIPDLVIPDTVSARQIRLWLINNGILLSQVENAINNIEDPFIRESTKVEWEYAPYVERSHPMLIPLGQALGLTEQQIDQAFFEASQI